MLNLKDFIYRANVLQLYRSSMKLVYRAPQTGDREQLKEFIKHEFSSTAAHDPQYRMTLLRQRMHELAHLVGFTS
jgi:hypothetical protein